VTCVARVWVDGALVDERTASVSVFDHGLTVGDGIFETLRVTKGQPFALTRHLVRLARSARGLGLPEPDPDIVRGACREVLDAARVGEARLRITYTGGLAPPGSGRGSARPTLIVTVSPLDAWPRTAVVATVPWPRNERSAVSGLKTTSYAENVVALAHAQQSGGSEALMPNTRGQLCEGTGSNVFVVLDGVLVTPPLSSGCLPGVTRDLVIEWYGGEERELPMEALVEADEVFLTSSTRNIQPVEQVDDHQVPQAPGEITKRVQEVFLERSAAELDP
jgi:branched-chain amino acid aminotransferase